MTTDRMDKGIEIIGGRVERRRGRGEQIHNTILQRLVAEIETRCKTVVKAARLLH